MEAGAAGAAGKGAAGPTAPPHGSGFNGRAGRVARSPGAAKRDRKQRARPANFPPVGARSRARAPVAARERDARAGAAAPGGASVTGDPAWRAPCLRGARL